MKVTYFGRVSASQLATLKIIKAYLYGGTGELPDHEQALAYKFGDRVKRTNEQGFTSVYSAKRDIPKGTPFSTNDWELVDLIASTKKNALEFNNLLVRSALGI